MLNERMFLGQTNVEIMASKSSNYSKNRIHSMSHYHVFNKNQFGILIGNKIIRQKTRHITRSTSTSSPNSKKNQPAQK